MSSVTRKPRAGRAERQEQRREEIGARLLAALERILAEGTSYTELSVERLIREAGVARSTFYAYFEDKGDLLDAVGSELVDDLVTSLGTWLSLGPGMTEEDLAVGIRALVDGYVPHRAVITALFETAPHDPRIAELVETRGDELRGAIAEHLARGIADGVVRADLRPEPTAVWIGALLERGLQSMLDRGRPDDVDRTVDAITALLWNVAYRPVDA